MENLKNLRNTSFWRVALHTCKVFAVVVLVVRMCVETYPKESLNNLINNVFISVPLSLCISP